VRYCLVSRAAGLQSGDGSDRGAYRIEIQSLSTGPVVRGTCVPDLPIIPTHKCATRVRNVSIPIGILLLQAPRAVAMMAVSPGVYCEDSIILLYT